jgi:diguanylate cyclase (GGDEF)-like protein
VSEEQGIAGASRLVRLDSIKGRIVALALLATLVPALSTAALSYVQNRRALTETLQGELRGLGSQSARELDLWVRDHFYEVRVFVGSFEVSENLDRLGRGGPGATEARTRLTNYLTRMQSRFGDYAELRVVDADEQPVASSSATLREAPLHSEWLPALRRGETVLGEPYFDESLDAVVTTIAEPIFESVGARFLGALLATLRFGAIEELLAGFAPGTDGRVDLITDDGRTIAGSSPLPPLEQAVSEATLADLEVAGGGTMEYVTGAGTPVVGVLTVVPGLDWAVVTQIPRSEAYAQFTRLRNSTIVLVAFLLLFVGSIAYFLGHVIVRPLERLASGAGAVARGDLSVDLPVEGRGEVAYLTEVFNKMVGQLRLGREELSDANAALREHNLELERLSMTDGLTGLYNRRYVMNELEKEIQRARRHDRRLAVLMIDVDRFKQYNDDYGHQAGDEVLNGMGAVIRDATRDPDVPARYGGEEFIVLLPDCDLEGSIEAAGRIRARLGEEVFESGTVTCSLGAAEFPTHGNKAAELIAAADAALYQAKAAGRDRVVGAPPPGMASTEGEEQARPKKDTTGKKR